MSKQKRRFKRNLVKVSGFFAGSVFELILGYSLFTILQKQLKFSFLISITATLTILLFLTFLIAVHKSSRCIFFLLIPQFFSSKGRTTIVACMMLMAITGPGKNLMKNVHVLTSCLACGQVSNYL